MRYAVRGPQRALVFGKESAKIFGQVIVNKDGSKTFKRVEIKPFDTNFDLNTIHGIRCWRPLAKSVDENTILKIMVVGMRFSIVVAGVLIGRILIVE